MIEITDLTALVEREKNFSVNDYFGEKSSDDEEVIAVKGSSGLLFTAPHATKHSRHGEVKSSDEYTGALTLLLAEKMDASALIGNYYNPDLEHVTQLSSSFISELELLSRDSHLIIDVHGMKDSHASGLCIGTGSQDVSVPPVSEFLDSCILTMAEWGPSHNFPFNAESPYTLTHYAESFLSSAAIQLEIPRRFRVPGLVPIGEQLRYLNALVQGLKKAQLRIST
jgi:hypothetical protein